MQSYARYPDELFSWNPHGTETSAPPADRQQELYIRSIVRRELYLDRNANSLTLAAKFRVCVAFLLWSVAVGYVGYTLGALFP